MAKRFTGHVEKRSKKFYTIVIDKGRKADGSRDRDYIPTEITNKRLAEEEKDQVLNEYRSGTYIPPSTLTLKKYLELWIEQYCVSKKLSPRTIQFNENMFEVHTIPFLGETILLDEVGPFDLQRYYNYLRNEGRKDGKSGGLEESSVFKQHCILHKAFDCAVKWKFIKENPADFVEKPSRPNSQANCYYVPEQAIKMLEYARDYEPHDKYTILLIAVYGGVRRGENIGLRRQDIDWENNILKIRQTVQYTKEKGVFFKGTKSKKGIRDIMVPSLIMDALRKHLKNQQEFRDALGQDYIDNDLVFCQDDGKPLFPDTISSWFPKFLDRHNLPRIRFHDLRHTNITIMIANNVPDNEIARRAGHADPATPKRLYGHVFSSMKDDATRAIENALKPTEVPKNPETPTPTGGKVIAFPKRNLA